MCTGFQVPYLERTDAPNRVKQQHGTKTAIGVQSVERKILHSTLRTPQSLHHDVGGQLLPVVVNVTSDTKTTLVNSFRAVKLSARKAWDKMSTAFPSPR
jgi:hypothetical protein